MSAHLADPDWALDVFCGADRVGRLAFDPGTDQFSFAYSADWLSHPRRFQLSPHIPLNGPAAPAAIRRYIDNLLPEGQALDVISHVTHIQKTHLFGLIRLLGQETAGALSWLPAGQRPELQTPQRRPLGYAELQQRIDARDRVPFALWDDRVRMSVAGYQDKLLVLREGSELFLADGALSSTHLLKPEPLNPHLPFMVANEHFCMKLVNRLSQRRWQQDWAAEVEILRVPAPVLCVTRFDRVRVGGRVQRRHVIDGCQALNLPVSAKYERTLGNAPDVRHLREGASFQGLAALRPHWANAAVGVRQLAMWATTTLLLGNSDAHGKNISFFGQGDTLTVAPFYDAGQRGRVRRRADRPRTGHGGGGRVCVAPGQVICLGRPLRTPGVSTACVCAGAAAAVRLGPRRSPDPSGRPGVRGHGMRLGATAGRLHRQPG